MFNSAKILVHRSEALLPLFTLRRFIFLPYNAGGHITYISRNMYPGVPIYGTRAFDRAMEKGECSRKSPVGIFSSRSIFDPSCPQASPRPGLLLLTSKLAFRHILHTSHTKSKKQCSTQPQQFSLCNYCSKALVPPLPIETITNHAAITLNPESTIHNMNI